MTERDLNYQVELMVDEEVLSRCDIPLKIALPLDDWFSAEFKYDRRRGLLVGFHPENEERSAEGKRKLWHKPEAPEIEMIVAGLNEIAERARAWRKRMKRKIKREIHNGRPLAGVMKSTQKWYNSH